MFCVTVSVLGQQQYCRVSGKPGFYLCFLECTWRRSSAI